jgi:cytochrome c-type biogenesis protein CcmH
LKQNESGCLEEIRQLARFRELMKHRSLFTSVVTAVLVWMGTSLAVSAQAPLPTPSDNQVNQVAHQLYCPVCENISLDVCPTQACAEWRELIRQKLALGWTEQQIKDYFAMQYGDRVLAEPPTRGLNLIVYILPPVAFLGGALVVFGVLRQMRKPRSMHVPADSVAAVRVSPPAPSGEDPYLQRVEEELKRHEKE